MISNFSKIGKNNQKFDFFYLLIAFFSAIALNK